MKGKTAVISCNEVQKQLCRILIQKGFDCKEIDCKSADTKNPFEGCNRIILPFPSKGDNLNFFKERETASLFCENQTLIGGMISREFISKTEKYVKKHIDYFKDEAYVLKNANITSQGAVRLLLDNTSCFLPGKRVLITGFGRIGKSLASMLKGLGLKVFVAARSRNALIQAECSGFDSVDMSVIPSTVFYYDYIFNTVPGRIFTAKDIKHMKNDVIYFELASAPFGADKTDFSIYTKKYVDGGSLPGRLYPQAAAANIADYILQEVTKWKG